MEYLLFIQKYYFYLILLFLIVIPTTFLSYFGSKKVAPLLINLAVILFAGWSVNLIGNRGINIGIDTLNYFYSFSFYSSIDNFIVRKDLFYDYLSYVIAQNGEFKHLLLLCAFLYVFGYFYGLKKIFSKQYYLPFLVFLMSPNFIDFGINVMRSGVAGSVFLVGLGLYYNKAKLWMVYLVFTLSMFFHMSVALVFFCFILTYYFKNTLVFFLIWCLSLVLFILNINIIMPLMGYLDGISILDAFTSRGESYAAAEGQYSAWYQFAMFGLLPIGFAVYNIFVLKYKDEFYIRLTNIYILIYIPCTILMSTRFGYRIAYLAGFMMPVILLYPLLKDTKIKIKFRHLKLSLIVFALFIIKAYKILVI